MRRRTSGKVGRGGGPAAGRAATAFFPEPQVLQEGERDHGQERMVVQPAPTPPLESQMRCHPSREEPALYIACIQRG